MILVTQNRQAIYNFDDVSRLYVTGRGTGIQAVTKNGSGGEVAQYRSREQATFVMGMFQAAAAADDRTFVFPTQEELTFASQHGSSGGGHRHGGS